MKVHFLFLCVFLLLCNETTAQRYLSSIFQETEVTTDITYGAATNYLSEEEQLTLDFYQAKDDTEQQRPLIIFTHGGGFVDQAQTKSGVHIVAFCDSMARKGYVAASINYRLDSTICQRAIVNAMHDLKATIRYFKKEHQTYRVDTNLIFVGGESAGAITSLSAAYVNTPAELEMPEAALPRAEEQSVEGISGNPGYTSNVTGVMCFCGGTKTTLNEFLFDTLAMESALDPPLMQVHGTNDLLISTASALEVSIRASNLELPFLFYPLFEATHCPWFFPLPNSFAYLDTLIDFTVPFLYAFILETSIDETASNTDNDVKIFPNPSSREVQLQFGSALKEDVDIVIYTSNGYSVYKDKIQQGQSDFEIQHLLPSGMYFIKIHSNQFSKVLRMQVKSSN